MGHMTTGYLAQNNGTTKKKVTWTKPHGRVKTYRRRVKGEGDYTATIMG